MQGERLGPYLIQRELGSGGMGKVFAAKVEREAVGITEGATVAVKVIHPHLIEAGGFFKRFLREAQIGKAVEHDNVVSTLDCDAAGGHHFLVMEYVEGQTLRELADEFERVPEELCRHVGREICKGLGAIHAVGVVHRDMKPENVLITPDHEVKVMDLGVARLVDEAIRLSASGSFVGSVEYAAPEQFSGEEADDRSDLHALGLMLYELSSGHHPYRAEDFRTIMRRACEEEPRRLGEINPQLSAFFEEVVHTLLAKRREERFDSADLLLDVLEQGEESAWWRKRSRAIREATQKPLRRIRIPRETAVYGRERELEKLVALYEQAQAGEGGVVLIEGEAGIGKSRLVDELVHRLKPRGEAVNFLFGAYPPGGAATAGGAFSNAFKEHFGMAGSVSHLGQSPLLAPAFDAVLRGEPPPEDAVELTKDSLVTCFVHATRNLAAEHPTILLIEDLHFAPDESRALFMALALAVPGHRVLLIGTMRPGVQEDWVAHLTRLDQAAHLTLDRLGPQDLAALLGDCFGSSRLAEELGWRIAQKSDGNPFFVFEIIRGLREGQFITRQEDGSWISTRQIDQIQIPSSVLDLVNARVADLTDAERDVLDMACCAGFEFDPTVVADALGIAPIPALKCLGQIERKHRLVRAAGNDYIFDHHQVQEALYAALHNRLREHYHAALADALVRRAGAADGEPERVSGALCVRLCEHFLAGAAGERALRYLPGALTHLEQGYLNEQAGALAEAVLTVPDLLVGTERAKLLLRLGRVEGPLDLIGARDRQRAACEQAKQLALAADDDELAARAAQALGWCFMQTFHHSEAEASLRHALSWAQGAGDREFEASTLDNLGSVLNAYGRLDEAREHHEQSLSLLRELGHRKGQAASASRLAAVLGSQGDFAAARAHFERHLALCKELGSRRGETIATGNLGVLALLEGRFDEAREDARRFLALCRETGDRMGEVRALSTLGNVALNRGFLARAHKYFERNVELSREIGFRQGEALATGNLGAACWAEGRMDDAQRLAQRYLELCREVEYREGEVLALLALSEARLASGEPPSALPTLYEAKALAEDAGYRSHLARIGTVIGTQLAAAGDEAGAREELEAALALAEAGTFAEPLVRARCQLALMPGGTPGDALFAVQQHEEQLSDVDLRAAYLALWNATNEREHLDEAKRLLDEAVANVPSETRVTMLENVPVNRDILAAWKAAEGT